MSDREWADWLRSVPRELSAQEVERKVRFRDQQQGEYFNHHLNVHHFGEAGH